jgi:hypothetical protein
MVVATVEHVPVALVHLAHTKQYTAESYLLSRACVRVGESPCPPSPKRHAPFIPMAQAQGFSGAGLGKKYEEKPFFVYCPNKYPLEQYYPGLMISGEKSMNETQANSMIKAPNQQQQAETIIYESPALTLQLISAIIPFVKYWFLST